MPTQWTRTRVARLVDHTLLKPEATEADVEALTRAATDLGVFAVCVSPSMVPAASRAINEAASADLVIAAVVGFPSGKHLSEIKAHEAARAVLAGAAEVDMVIDVGAAISGAIGAVHDDVSAVRQANPDTLLKVIVESAALLEFADERTLRDVCTAVADAGADFVKTSTGFHPAGGASARAVDIMAAAVGPAVAVKASGGIRTAAAAVAMLEAGATRLGLSGTRAVLDGLD